MAAGIATRQAGTRARKLAASTSQILGIDPGLDRTGYAVIDTSSRQGVRVIDAGIIRTDSQMTLAYRLGEIQKAMDEVLAEHPVSLVAVEDLYAHYQHPRTAILMGHARGVILLTAARRTIPVLSFPATNIKKMLTGNGHAGKLQMQRAIVSTFRLRALPQPPDVADAMAVAWCAGMCRKNS